MADVDINVSANMREALKQAEELSKKFNDLSKTTISPALPDLSKYTQSINQLTNSMSQLQKQVQQLQSQVLHNPNNTASGSRNNFSRINSVGIPTSANQVRNKASMVMFNNPQDMANFMRASGFRFTGQEIQRLSNIGGRVGAGMNLTDAQGNAFAKLYSKFQTQADELADKLTQERKAYGPFSKTQSGQKILSDVEKKFSNLDQAAGYFENIEQGLGKGGGVGSSGGSGGFKNILGSIGKSLLTGLGSALGPASQMFGLGALGYGTYTYMQSRQQAGQVGTLTGYLNGAGSNKAYVNQLMGLGKTAGYYTTGELTNAMSLQSLYGGQYAGKGALLNRDITSTGQLARGFGMDVNQTAQAMGGYQAVGGFTAGSEKNLADALASAIKNSGVDPRQYVQANQQLIQQLSQQMGNVNVKQTMQLQTYFDALGKQYGSSSLIGARGAQTIEQMNQGFSNPGGGSFGEATVLNAIKDVTGLTGAKAIIAQEKGLNGFSNKQIGSIYSNVWNQILKSTGGDEDTAELSMANIMGFGNNIGTFEQLRKSTKNFTKMTTADYDKYIKGTTASSAENAASGTGALDTQKTLQNINDAANKIGSSISGFADAAAKFADKAPGLTVALGTFAGVVPSLVNALKGAGGGGGGGNNIVSDALSAVSAYAGGKMGAGAVSSAAGALASGVGITGLGALGIALPAAGVIGYDLYNQNQKKITYNKAMRQQAKDISQGKQGIWTGAAGYENPWYDPAGTITRPTESDFYTSPEELKELQKTKTSIMAAPKQKFEWWNPTTWFKHAVGLPYVPYDNYPAILHEGESVLTKDQNATINNKYGTDNLNDSADKASSSLNKFSELLNEMADNNLLYHGGQASISNLVYSSNSKPNFQYMGYGSNMGNGSVPLQAGSGPSNIPYRNYFLEASQETGVPAALLEAIAKNESGFKANGPPSSAGAMGIMQLMPGTAKSLGVTNPYDPEQNILAGAKYIEEQLNKYDGDVKKAAAAYNAGPGAVDKYNGVPPYTETQNYVKKVIQDYQTYLNASSDDGTLSGYNVNITFKPKAGSPTGAPTFTVV